LSQSISQFDTRQVTGVLLAGGLGRRLGGGDKGLVALAGRPLIAHAASRLAPQVGRLIVNANGDPARFADLGLPVVADETADFPGPLAGVLAVLRWIAREARGSVFLASVAADVPFVPSDLVQRLAAALATYPSAGVAVAQSRGRRRGGGGGWGRDAASAFAAGVARGASWRSALEQAVVVASRSVEHPGARGWAGEAAV
jgi:molybdopterin-guanine dinucleotide biosynthesis protein A